MDGIQKSIPWYNKHGQLHTSFVCISIYLKASFSDVIAIQINFQNKMNLRTSISAKDWVVVTRFTL